MDTTITAVIFGYPEIFRKTVEVTYRKNIDNHADAADDAFSLFNNPARQEELLDIARSQKPENSRFRSLSVGDLVIVKNAAGVRCFFCQSVGWKDFNLIAAKLIRAHVEKLSSSDRENYVNAL